MSKLALLGGDPTVTLNYDEVGTVPIVPEKAYKTVEDLMRKGEISTSPIVGQFEKRFADYIGTKYALAAVNGTTTIQEGLFAVGVQPGDEVIVPSFTFFASALPIVALGAIPVFCDVLLDSHNMDAKSVESLITDKTKAIVVVHVWGTPADMDPIMDVAKRHNLKVVEDASHAHGAKYKGKKVGTFGDVGCFSMQGSKTLPAGEAGMLVTSDKTVFERACALGHYERLGKLVDSKYSQFSLTALGFKHRVHPLAIAIADANLDTLDELNAVRTKNAQYLEAGIADLDFIQTQKVDEGIERIYAYHYVRYIPENFGGVSLTTFLTAVAKEGVTCGSCGYGKLHQAPVFTNKEDGELTLFNPAAHFSCDYDLPVTAVLAENAFMIAPRFETDCKELIDQFIAAYHKVAENKDALVQYEKEHNIEKKDNAGRSINIFR